MRFRTIRALLELPSPALPAGEGQGEGTARGSDANGSLTLTLSRKSCGRGDRNQRGFTLLEILIAVAIIGVGFTALLGLHGKNIKSTAFDQQLSLATLLARQSVSELQFNASTKGLQALHSSAGNFDLPGFRYEIEIADTELEEVKRATVRVIFDDRAPRACEVIYFIRGQV